MFLARLRERWLLTLTLTLLALPASANAQGGVVRDEMRLAPLMLSPGESAVLSFVDTLARKRAIAFACDPKIDFFCPEPEAPVEVRLQLFDLSGAVLATQTQLVPGGKGTVFEVPYESVMNDHPQPCMFVAIVEAFEPDGPGGAAGGGGVFERALASLQVFDGTTGAALATIGTEGSLRLHAEIPPLPVFPIGGPF